MWAQSLKIRSIAHLNGTLREETPKKRKRKKKKIPFERYNECCQIRSIEHLNGTLREETPKKRKRKKKKKSLLKDIMNVAEVQVVA